MGLRVLYLDVAVRDLQSIYDYISQDSKKYASLEIKKIKSYTDSLRKFPLKGKILRKYKRQRSIINCIS